jgi:hypothetical protein
MGVGIFQQFSQLHDLATPGGSVDAALTCRRIEEDLLNFPCA